VAEPSRSTPDGTALIDGHGTMLFVNDLLSSLTGYTREELTDENVQMLVPPQHKNKEFDARNEHARNPNTRIIWSDQDLTVLRKDGSELLVDFALSPLTIEASAGPSRRFEIIVNTVRRSRRAPRRSAISAWRSRTTWPRCS